MRPARNKCVGLSTSIHTVLRFFTRLTEIILRRLDSLFLVEIALSINRSCLRFKANTGESAYAVKVIRYTKLVFPAFPFVAIAHFLCIVGFNPNEVTRSNISFANCLFFCVISQIPLVEHEPSVSISPCKRAHRSSIDASKYDTGICLLPSTPRDTNLFRIVSQCFITGSTLISLTPFHLDFKAL